MSSDTVVYNPSDVASLLNIKLSTLRKYANVLQDAGYHFHRNEKGYRGYFEKDVIVMRRFIEMKSHPDMTLEQAANAIMTWVNQSDMSSDDTENDTDEKRYITYDEFKKFQERQEEQLQQVVDLNKELLNRLEKQQEHLDNRDQKLMNVLNETLETRKQISSNEEKQKDSKKGFLQKLFFKKK